MNTYYLNDTDNGNTTIDTNYNVIMDNNNSINSNETIILPDELIKIFHQPYQVSTIKQSQPENILINENENENNSLNSILKKCIITSVLCCLIILCIVFI
jgi:hypothetical protein